MRAEQVFYISNNFRVLVLFHSSWQLRNTFSSERKVPRIASPILPFPLMMDPSLESSPLFCQRTNAPFNLKRNYRLSNGWKLKGGRTDIILGVSVRMLCSRIPLPQPSFSIVDGDVMTWCTTDSLSEFSLCVSTRFTFWPVNILKEHIFTCVIQPRHEGEGPRFPQAEVFRQSDRRITFVTSSQTCPNNKQIDHKPHSNQHINSH